jgi:hypothetical protein
LEAITRSGRPASASLASSFFTWLQPLVCTFTHDKASGLVAAEERQGRLACAWSAVKIPVYRLIGLNGWAGRRLDVYLSLRAYRKTFGRNPNLSQPTLFSEKVTARKLFDRRPVFFTLADKLRAREFAAARIGAQHLPRLFTVCERFEEIDFDRLPDKFVIKTNHGSHWVLFVGDKAALDKAAARRLVNRWLRTNYYVNSRECFYKNVKPRIMIEEYLLEDSGAPILDFRLYAFDGAVKFFSIQRRLAVDGARTFTRFTRARERLPDPVTSPASGAPAPLASIEFPANLEQILEIGDRLAQGFDFIRVDLYNPGGRIVYGELTTLPMGGVRPFNPLICDRMFGQEWNLKLGAAES